MDHLDAWCIVREKERGKGGGQMWMDGWMRSETDVDIGKKTDMNKCIHAGNIRRAEITTGRSNLCFLCQPVCDTLINEQLKLERAFPYISSCMYALSIYRMIQSHCCACV